MKKLISMLLSAAMVLSLAACGSNTAPSGSGNGAGSGTPAGSNAGTQTGGDWPTKTITLLCGYSAGGSSDLGCRYLAEALKDDLGVPVIVENVPGSASWLAWNQLLQNTEFSFKRNLSFYKILQPVATQEIHGFIRFVS